MTTPPAADDLGGRSGSRTITLPSDAMVVLVGVAASGKSTFAAANLPTTQVLSSDALRALVSDDPTAQEATDDAFDLLHRILAMRLRRGRLTVVDATNVEGWARDRLMAVARRHRRPGVAIVLDMPLALVLGRNANRAAPRPPPPAIRRQHRQLHDELPAIDGEGFDAVHLLTSPQEADAVQVEIR
ncbi:MAG: AAA family ATPase [Candidatus Limnocylindria bacterium]